MNCKKFFHYIVYVFYHPFLIYKGINIHLFHLHNETLNTLTYLLRLLSETTFEIKSNKYSPGPYSGQESLLAAYDEHYLGILNKV